MKTMGLMAAAAAVVGLVSGMDARAAYPEKPITLVIPFAAGGGSDALARTIQKAIEAHKLLGQPLAIVNKGGAGGTIGARSVKDATPDGYTFLQIHQALFATKAAQQVEFGAESFTPVIQTSQSCLYLAVPASSPYKTLQDLIQAGKARPGALKQADQIGGVSHFPSVLIEQKSGADFGIVNVGGTSKRFASMTGGHTDFALMSIGWLERGGDKLRGLAVLAPERLALAPDLPTAKEQGVDVSGCLVRRYWAPKGTPADRIDAFADAIEAAMKTPELVEFHQKTKQDMVVLRGAALARAIGEDVAAYDAAAEGVIAAMKSSK